MNLNRTLSATLALGFSITAITAAPIPYSTMQMRVPNAEMPMCFSVSGAGEPADQACSGSNDATSFRAPVRKTYDGRCLAILRPKGGSGKITLNAEADRLKPATIVVRTR